MAHRSYLDRVVGGGGAGVKLAPPRVLFRPPVLPVEATNGLEMTAETRRPPQSLTASPSVPRSRASVLSPGIAASNPHTPVGVNRAAPAPEDHAPAGSRHTGLDEGPAATSESAHRQSQLTPVSPQSHRAERDTEKGAHPAVPAYSPGPRGVAAEARDARSLQEGSGLEPPAVATPGPRKIAAGPITDEPSAGSPGRPLRTGEPTLLRGMTTGHDPADDQQERSPLEPVAGIRADSSTRDLPGVDRTSTSGSLAPPIRLEPPVLAQSARRPDPGERTAGVRIGSLEVRILLPPAEPASATMPRPNPAAATRSAPAFQPAGPLSRGFRCFGLVQG